MPLKRGLERESCDFCHRRKIKCDRTSRTNQGLPGCSHCALREVECRLDDADDIRIRRRRQTRSQSVVADSSAGEQRTNTFSQFGASFSSATPLVASQTAQATASPVNLVLPHPFLDASSFELCSDSIFLDQIFVKDDGSPPWGSSPATIAQQDAHSAMRHQASERQQPEPVIASHPDITICHKYWESCNIDSASFVGALHAYFKIAALCLPVVIEDAFWQDFEAGRCSDALVFAIACRGICFTEVADKWEVQQRLASKFRDAFLDAQEPVIRLDNLEALALMIHFQYEESPNSSLQSRVGQLFLTHNALVLMILQADLQNRDSGTSDSETALVLARAEERRTLLFWHVYGVDAFRSIDTQRPSQIPDDDDELTEKPPLQENGGYLDAILVLAINARKIVHVSCHPTARRKGIKPAQVLSLYDQLEQWRHRSYPKHFQLSPDSPEKLTSETEVIRSTPLKAGRIAHLHRAVLSLLECDLYMQIENCVSRYGIADETAFEAEMAAHRVEYETLRSAHRVVEVCQWSKQYEVQGEGETRHSLADLAPIIVGNIFAGICFWTCTHGKDVLLRRFHSITRFKLLQSPGNTVSGERDIQERVRRYVKSAEMLRDAVAIATSHNDTSKILDRLEKQLRSLEEDFQEYEQVG